MPDKTPRFSETLPPLDPITESHWDRLNGEERADLLRRRHQQVVEALSWNVEATREVSKQVDESVMPMLEANTAATSRTEAKVDASVLAIGKSDEKLDLLIKRTDKPLAIWQDWEGATSLVGRLASVLKDLAPIALALGACFGAWQAILAWGRAGFPGPWK